MRPVLSVIISTRNRKDKLCNAIGSILANTFRDFELIVVDNSSDDSSMSVVKSFRDPRLRYIRTEVRGLARARNIGVRESKTEIIIFTDDDCVCDKGWLEAILNEYEKDSSLMGVYGRVLPYGKGSQDMICHCTIDSMERKIVGRPIIPYTVLGHGNNMSFRKDVFRTIGLYIESLGAGTSINGGEDTEFIYRSLRKRMKFCYSPAAIVYHDNWMPKEKAVENLFGAHMGAGAIFAKYAFMFDKTAFFYLIKRGRDIILRLVYFLGRGNKDEVVRAIKDFGYFSLGILLGVKYLIDPVIKLEGGKNKSMQKQLTIDQIKSIKELYMHPYEKHKRLIDDMILFQETKLDIKKAHYRKVKGFDTPYEVGNKEYHHDNDICGGWEYVFILMNLPLKEGLVVMEAASAASIMPAYLTALGFNFISVDLDVSSQENIKRENGINYQTIEADLKQIPLPDESVDVIISNSSLEHVEEDVLMWKEFTRILRKGGKMIHTFPIAKPGFRNAWLQEPVDFFANPTKEHDRTHRLVDKKIAESRYFIPNNLWVEIWEEYYYHREIQACCVVVKE